MSSPLPYRLAPNRSGLFSPFLIRIAFAAGTLIGFGLIPRLSLQYLPTGKQVNLEVETPWPGMSAQAVEQEVTTPLEGALQFLDGVGNLRSESSDGWSRIYLEVDEKQDLDHFRFLVATRIRQLVPALPSGTGFPQLRVRAQEEESEQGPLLTYSLSGPDAPSVIFRYANEQFSPRVALIRGLLRVETLGGNEREWQVGYQARSLLQLGLSNSDLVTAIRQAQSTEGLGAINQGAYQWPLRLRGWPIRDADDLRRLPVADRNGKVIRLGSLAEIQRGEQAPASHYRINGANSIRLLFYPEPGVNTLHLGATVRRELAAAARSLPPGYRLYLDEDRTEFLREELVKIRDRSLLSLGILLLFVGLTYRSWHQTLHLLATLLANLGLAAIGYYLLSVELHLYALAGITVSFGIIIDNMIVMGHQWKSRGDRRVFPALVAATATTVSSLLIVLFLPERWQINLWEFSRVLMINLGVSLLVAALLVPALDPEGRNPSNTPASRSFRWRRTMGKAYRVYRSLLLGLIRFRRLAILLVILAFGLPVFWLPRQVEGWPWYNRTLGSDTYLEYVRPWVNRALGGSFRLFSYYVYEGAMYRSPEETELYVRASLPSGSTLEQMDILIRKMEGFLGQYERELKQFTAQVYSGESAFIRITFQPDYSGSFPHQLKARLIGLSLNYQGVSWSIYGVGQGFSNRGGVGVPSYRVKMKGYNQEELLQQARRMADKLTRHPRVRTVDLEGAVNFWQKDRYQFAMELDRRRLLASGFPPSQITQVLAPADRNRRPTARLANGEALRLYARTDRSPDLWTLQHSQLSLDSLALDLGNTAGFVKSKVTPAIHKEEQEYVRILEYEYTGSDRFGSKHLENVLEEMRLEMPLGFSAERVTYSFWGQEEKQLNYLMLLVILAIFFICSVLFESLRQAAMIVVLIPISFIGIFLTFYWFDFPFDQGGYTSFVMVAGLVVNGLILILHEFNSRRRDFPHLPFLTAYLQAFRQRIVPILLSIVSTVLGLLPFLLHGPSEVFWYALAVGTMGGLIFSVLVLFLVIPLFILPRLI